METRMISSIHTIIYLQLSGHQYFLSSFPFLPSLFYIVCKITKTTIGSFPTTTPGNESLCALSLQILNQQTKRAADQYLIYPKHISKTRLFDLRMTLKIISESVLSGVHVFVLGHFAIVKLAASVVLI